LVIARLEKVDRNGIILYICCKRVWRSLKRLSRHHRLWNVTSTCHHHHQTQTARMWIELFPILRSLLPLNFFDFAKSIAGYSKFEQTAYIACHFESFGCKKRIISYIADNNLNWKYFFFPEHMFVKFVIVYCLFHFI
jgi:hypothetical protein